MSLHHAAQHLAAQGRGPDTMLVHMAPNELKALNQFAKSHGTHLTVNPKTGLPEAGLLSTLFGGLTAIFAPQLLPYVAGGIGVAATAKTGSLGQGLMEGLSAWTGGQLAGNIQSLGASVPSSVAPGVADTAGTLLPEATNAAVNTNIGSSLMGAPSNLVNTNIGLSNIGAAGTSAGGFAGALGQTVPAQLAGQGIGTAASSLNPAAASSMFSPETVQGINNFGAGANKLISSPIDSVKEIWNMPGGKGMLETSGKSNLISAGLNVLPLLQPDPYKPPEKEENPMNLKSISKDFKGLDPRQPKPYYAAQYRDYVTNPYMPSYYKSADGGLQSVNKYAGEGESYVRLANQLLQQPRTKPADITPTDPGAAYSPLYNSIGIVPYEKGSESQSADKMATDLLKYAKSLGKMAASTMMSQQDPATTAIASIANETPTSSAKEGGLQGYALGGLSMGHLGGYSDGGRLLKGPGDGVSDSIPASIGAKQPARLAEGEFVIPARIVSELGNGSTDAGAKRLYAMMDRIKAKRRKTKDIAADSKAYKLLPA
jgi:hypothetical protein